MVSAEEILLRIRGQDDTGSAFNSVQSRAGAIKTAVGGAVTAMSASMLGYAKSAVDSAMTAEQEWMKFGNAVKNTGGNWEEQSDQIRKWVKDYSNNMGRSVADTRAAMTTYMNMGMSLQDSQQAMQATSNYAAQMGMSQEEAAGQLQKAFMGNGRALKALGLDIANYKDETTGAIDRQKLLNDVLQRTGGAADKYAESSTAKFQRLNNVLASLKTDFGAALMDAITPLIPVVQSFLNVINGLPGPVKTVGFAAIALGAGIGLIAGPLTSVMGLLEMMGVTLPSLSAVMGVLSTETGVLTAEEMALAAAQAGLTAEEIGAAAAHATNGAAVAAEGAAATGASTGFWAMAAAELAALWPVLLIIAAVAALIVVVEQIGEALGWWTDFGTMLDAIRAGVMRLWEAFINSPQVQGVLSAIQSAFQALWNFLQPIFSWIGAAWNNLFSSEGAGSGGPDAVGAIINAFGTLGNIASQVFTAIQIGWSMMAPVIMPVINMITRVATIFAQLATGQINFQQAVVGVFTAVGTMYQQIGTELLNLAMTVVTGFVNRIRQIPARIGQIISQAAARLGAVGAMMVARALNLGIRVFNGIVNRIRQIPGRIGSIMGQIPGRIGAIAGAAAGAASNLAMMVLQAVVQGVAGLAMAVYNEFIKIGDKIRESVSSAVSAATAFGNDIKNAVLGALGIASPGIIQRKIAIEFQDIPGRIDENLGGVYRSAQNYASNILSGFNTPSYTPIMRNALNNQYTPENQRNNQGNTYIINEGAIHIDARNKTETEAKQMLVLALEGLRGIDEDIRGI